MWIVIDGYNLIRRSPRLSLLDRRDMEEGREALLTALAAYRRLKGHRITVIFDGWERGGISEQVKLTAGLQVVFSRRGERADQAILRCVEKAPSGAIVVTSDRALANEVARTGALVLSTEEFHERLDRVLQERDGGEFQKDDESSPESSGPRRLKGPARRPSKQAKRRMTTLKRL
ncbi:NYN domain-containing protein [Candidatus Methylomirabilis sp.]|uniref:YacP-like NYN domain-containing protein n=1 Tax=Candidatus Methylomirabilis sp. TaxID=2032687 RepID=UPI003075FAAE